MFWRQRTSSVHYRICAHLAQYHRNDTQVSTFRLVSSVRLYVPCMENLKLVSYYARSDRIGPCMCSSNRLWWAFARFDEEQVPSSSIYRTLAVGIVGRRQQYIFHVFLCHPSGFFQDGKSIRGTFIIGLVPIDTRNSFVKTSNSSWRASRLSFAVGARATESTGLLHIGKI